MKKFASYFTLAAVILTGSLVAAGQIVVFSSGDTLSPTSLNSNFSHIHNTMIGGHGARLVDADVNPAAALSHSKLATPAVVPKAWATITANCASPCTETLIASSGVSSISHTGAGSFQVNWTVTRGDALYGVIVSPNGVNARHCQVVGGGYAAGNVIIGCYDLAAAAADSPFTIMMLDNL